MKLTFRGILLRLLMAVVFIGVVSGIAILKEKLRSQLTPTQYNQLETHKDGDSLLLVGTAGSYDHLILERTLKMNGEDLKAFVLSDSQSRVLVWYKPGGTLQPPHPGDKILVDGEVLIWRDGDLTETDALAESV